MAAVKPKAETPTPDPTPPPDPPAEGEGEGEGEADAIAAPPAPGVEPDPTGEPVLPEGMKLCPVCTGAGAVPEFIHEDPQTETCSTCGGIGELVTGSLIPDQAVQRCRDCGGAGFVSKLPPVPAYSQPPVEDTWTLTPADVQPVPLSSYPVYDANAGGPGY